MSNDLDDLDFLVQPIKHRKTKPYPAASLSAGEENRAERVLLFSQLAMMPLFKQTNLLVLDEIEGNLDPVGRKIFTETVVPKLRETFPDKAIVLISHEESLINSPEINHLWVAEKKNRKTTLKTHLYYTRRAAA
jgi:ATPase subunit of ABC transporter with duplicated ATPase domains